MAPLVVMLGAWFLSRLIGFTGWWADADSWRGALRYGLAGMFIFTAGAHFHPQTRADLVQMVPPFLPWPGSLVTVTGFFELAGAIGLLRRSSAPVAAYALIVLLVGLFPANVYAAQAGLMVAGQPASPLIWRLPLQLFWMWLLWWAVQERRLPPGEFHAHAIKNPVRPCACH